MEDAAHAIGAAYSCGKVGSKADLTTFSFQSWKNMTTLGEGGMITAKSDELAEKIRMLREFGCVSYGDRKIYEVMKHNPPWYQDFRKVSGHCGTNSRMTEAQAAMGLSQLAKIDKLNGERSRNAKLLRKMLSGIEEIEIPAVKEGIRHSYHIFTILLKTDKVRFSREDLLRELIETERIESYIQYVPIYHFSAFETNPAEANCPNAERFYGRLISLPIHPDLGEKDMTMISKALERSIARLRAAR